MRSTLFFMTGLLTGCLAESHDIQAEKTTIGASQTEGMPYMTLPEIDEPLSELKAFEPAPPEDIRLRVQADPRAIDSALSRATDEGAQTRLAIRLDRPLYQPGETLWARVWDLTADTLEDAGNHETYVTVLNAKGSPMTNLVYSASETRGGHIAIDLPKELPGGLYTLRATLEKDSTLIGGFPPSTSTITHPFVIATFEKPRIRKELEILRDAYGPGEEVEASLTLQSNQGPMAHHPVKVVVQVEGKALPPIETTTDANGEALLRFELPDNMKKPDAMVNVVIEEDGWTESISREVPIVLDDIQIEWYPEGGELVAGLPSRMYLAATDAHGEPADVSGDIVDGRGKIVASFKTLHDGLGRFEFTPKAGITYTTFLTHPIGAKTKDKPPTAAKNGCTLRSYDDIDSDLEQIRVGVHCTSYRHVVLTGSLRGKATDSAVVVAGPSQPTVVHLQPNTDGPQQGVARVTLLSDTLEPLAERLIYRNRQKDLQIHIQPKRTDYGPREEVVLEVTTQGPQGTPIAADVSLSVVDDRVLTFADDKNGHILSAIHLGPWLKSVPEDPAWYFDPDEPMAGFGLDLLLGTYGWRRFTKTKKLAYVPPWQAQMLQGRVPNPDAGEGARARREEGGVGTLLSGGSMDGFGGSMDSGRAGLLGAKGTQMGNGGLGSRTWSWGGVGTAGGVGGLGSRGSGLGGGGYGAGGGAFGTKGRIEMGSLHPFGALETPTTALPQQLQKPAFARKGNGSVHFQFNSPIVLGALARAKIDLVVHRHANAIRYCYQRELTRTPDLRGKFVVKLVISKNGTVSSSAKSRSTLHNEDVERCIVSRFKRMKFPNPTGGGIVIVSYPMIFTTKNHPIRLQNGLINPFAASMNIPYFKVRTFATPRYRGKPTPKQRTDFRSTVYWTPSLKTNSEGKATVRFPLSDSITTFNITAEGVGGGFIGRSETDLRSSRPFTLDVPLPLEVAFGDRLLMPVRLSTQHDTSLQVQLKTDITAPLQVEDGMDMQTLSLAANTGLTTVVPIVVPDVVGTAKITIEAEANGLTDTIERTLSVVPRGYPHLWTASGTTESQITHEFIMDKMLPGGTEAAFSLYPNQLTSLMDGMESMIRIPSGCFEQTSSTNYPNILLFQHLDQKGKHIKLAVSREKAIQVGYDRLKSFQVASGGFEMYGKGPGKVGLTAYGLRQFHDMRAVYPQVEEAILHNAARFLLKTRDGMGGYTTAKSWRGFGVAPKALTDAYITWSLVTSGGWLKDGPEIEQTRKLATTTKDPYLLAIAILTLKDIDTRAAHRAQEVLVTRQAKDGSFPGAKTSIVLTRGKTLTVEATSLAMSALEGSDHATTVIRAANWLNNARRANHGWGSTQATVLALKALTSFEQTRSQDHGSAEVYLDDLLIDTVHWKGDEKDSLHVLLGKELTSGHHRIDVKQLSGDPIPYSVGALWRRMSPVNLENAPLQLTTSMDKTEVKLGDTVRLTATLKAHDLAPVASPIARIGLPAGVRVENWQLEAMRDRNEIAFYETRPREVTLYFGGFQPNTERKLHLDLVAEVPGTFTSKASSAYPYYDADEKSWSAEAVLQIRP